MPLKGKVETVVELKSTPDQFYNVFRRQGHHVPKHTPGNIQGVELHEGDWETHGSIKIWKYSIGGKAEVFKEKVEYDDANKTFSLIGLEGDVFKIYKFCKVVFNLVPKGQGGLAICSIEYEKLDPNAPSPDHYLDVVVSITEEIDASISKA